MPSAQTVTGTDVQSNYLSGSGNPPGWGLYEGSQKAQPLPAMPLPLSLTPDNPAQYDAILKLCDGLDGRTLPTGSLSGLKVSQGTEDAVNIANGAHHLTLGGVFGGGATGLRVITLKGCHDVSFEPGTKLLSSGGWCDVKIGDWLDQSENADANHDLTNLSRVDGAKVRVCCNYRASNITFGPNCTRLFWYSVGLTAYWWLKYCVRKALRIPVGKSGPSILP